ncbi:probable cysteine desulfurase [Diadema setosum]|uniref:probable cysteine desulfurase n=1 Tax=Diadema setosum TaxID=31175 RepID=UPI003B39FFC1
MPPVTDTMDREEDVRITFAETDEVIPSAENFDAAERYVIGSIRRSVRMNSTSAKSAKRQLSSQISDAISEQSHEGVTASESEFDEQAAIAKHVEDNVVGKDTVFASHYGKRQVVYCDYTASGRAVKFIEDYITEHVQPLYANTHTTTGLMARQTTKFRKEARDIIKKCVNATEEDALIFTGSGTTGAVNKLVSALMLKGARAKKTVVLVGPYEHHSNLLPWKETGAKVVRIRDNSRGLIDMVAMEEILEKYQKKGKFMIGCFSAASNVTGIISDTHAVAALLHKYGALSFWDYATAGPYLRIDMNPASDDPSIDYSKDAVYLSPHKFVGGVGTPGILIAKKKLFVNAVPHSVGGGTVLYVTRETHHYVGNIEEREEGGTPAIVESIRAGLTFRLKESISTDYIEAREEELTKLAFVKWKKNLNLIFLGSSRANRLPIFSFMVVHPKTGKMLHHNFVAVLLNDLYGIQARGGCACAGPYAQDLLGIDEDLAERFVFFLKDESDELKKKKNGTSHAEYKKIKKTKGPLEIMKPGFVRLNLPFFFSDAVIDYVLEAVDAVGRNGWKMLSQYKVDPHTSEWQYVGTVKDDTVPEKASAEDSLLKATFIQGKFNAPPSPYIGAMNRAASERPDGENWRQYLSEGERLMKEAGQQFQFPKEILGDPVGECIGDENLIWFMRPFEAAYHIRYPEADPSDLIMGTNDTDGASGAAGNGSASADPRANLRRAPFKPKRYTKRSMSRRFSLKNRGRKSGNGQRSNGLCSIM